MPANKKRPTMAEVLSTDSKGGLLSFFERAALDAGTEPDASLDVKELRLDEIDPNPRQARQAFNYETLIELADSIREHGVIEPIVVRPTGSRYEIVAGERRHRAAGLARLETIPARIMHLDTEQAAIITALENLQREDLDIEDEARQFAYLLEITGLSQRKLAEKLGVNYNYLSRRVRLLKRPDLLEMYRSGRGKLHEVLSMLDQPLAGESTQGEPELIEREDMPGYIVVRVDSVHETGGSYDEGKAAMFRWRPAMQFRNWLNRTSITAIPPDERASFKAQIAEIKAKLDEWEKALEVQVQQEEPITSGDENTTRDATNDEPVEPMAS
ncbi:MAG: ParB family transcriptional regulator, chromosome partitioning protein [Chloroflexia bacterium]|nr:ParB family transcriptional regulator, chromosome partitioning protein [Chloroflexia bacterium]